MLGRQFVRRCLRLAKHAGELLDVRTAVETNRGSKDLPSFRRAPLELQPQKHVDEMTNQVQIWSLTASNGWPSLNDLPKVSS